MYIHGYVLGVTVTWNNLKLGTTVVLHTISQYTDLEFKRSMMGIKVRESAPICISESAYTFWLFDFSL